MTTDSTVETALAAAELFQLDRPTCVTLLTTQHIGRLVLGGEVPAVIPVNYSLVDGAVMFRTARTSRAVRSVARPVVFEVDMFDARTRSGWSVVVQGRLSEAPAAERRLVETWAPGERDQWLTVDIDVVTGRLLRGEPEPPTSCAGYL